MTSTLQGKTLFITGASRGIGLAIGLRAARDGANVAIAAKTAEAHPKLPGTIYSAAEEMKIVLAKTAYSPLLKVAGDYSCGIFEGAGSTMEEASVAKFERICRKLRLAPDISLLEIGSGWIPVAPLVYRIAGAREVILSDQHRLLHLLRPHFSRRHSICRRPRLVARRSERRCSDHQCRAA